MGDNLIGVSTEQHAAQKAAALAELHRCLTLPLAPVPEQSLRMLYDAACLDTGGSQACRYFLFWLAGQPDPTGYCGDGGLELRRLDGQFRSAALEVLTWWAGPTRSDRPLYEILAKLRDQFSNRAES